MREHKVKLYGYAEDYLNQIGNWLFAKFGIETNINDIVSWSVMTFSISNPDWNEMVENTNNRNEFGRELSAVLPEHVYKKLEVFYKYINGYSKQNILTTIIIIRTLTLPMLEYPTIEMSIQEGKPLIRTFRFSVN